MSDPNPPAYDPNRPDPGRSAGSPQSYGSASETGGYQQSYPVTPHAGSHPQTYGQPYGALPEHPQGTTILVLGIVGIFVTICAPIAWYLGAKAKKEIAASGIRYANEQNINIGRILGMVFSILAIVGIVIGIIVFIAVVVLAAASGGQ